MTNVRPLSWVLTLCFTFAAAVPSLHAQTNADPYKPKVGMAGKDAVWVPTAPVVVERMLDVAKVTPKDYVIDLGSGDGRNVIAAAKRGARALGVEYNNDLVVLSQRLAKEAGVSDKASFVQGDMYAADISKATVLALFLLTENMNKMVPKFLDLQPGSRIVVNTFGITGWTPDVTEQVEGDCSSWCTVLMWIVPAKVDGKWKMDRGELALKQEFQMISGTLTVDGKAAAISNGRLNGDRITFTVDGAEYNGRVSGNSMSGTRGNGANWKATR